MKSELSKHLLGSTGLEITTVGLGARAVGGGGWASTEILDFWRLRRRFTTRSVPMFYPWSLRGSARAHGRMRQAPLCLLNPLNDVDPVAKSLGLDPVEILSQPVPRQAHTGNQLALTEVLVIADVSAASIYKARAARISCKVTTMVIGSSAQGVNPRLI